MDDFNANVLSEAKNEYSSRLLSILTPLVLQGFKSILKEADELCLSNQEDQKYLMTFQNFLTRVPKWNQEIINNETKRIIETGKCPYLEDLLTCVHITQLKVLTSIRVSSKQKKIDIDIPKLHEFIHKIYIASARKIYQNVYLFEKNILPLTHQKNMRECELLVRECILSVIRESMPIEKILRAYIDETEEEEVVEEIVDVPKEEAVELIKSENIEKQSEDADSITENITNTIKEEVANEINSVKTAKIDEDNKDNKATLGENNLNNTNINQQTTVTPTNTPINSDSMGTNEKLSSDNTNINVAEVKKVTSFNDDDHVVNFKKGDDSENINKTPTQIITAPKTIERLEKISEERHKQRMEDEEDEDDDDDNEEDKIKILNKTSNLEFDDLDVQVLDKPLKLNNSVELSGVELLN